MGKNSKTEKKKHTSLEKKKSNLGNCCSLQVSVLFSRLQHACLKNSKQICTRALIFGWLARVGMGLAESPYNISNRQFQWNSWNYMKDVWKKYTAAQPRKKIASMYLSSMDVEKDMIKAMHMIKAALCEPHNEVQQVSEKMHWCYQCEGQRAHQTHKKNMKKWPAKGGSTFRCLCMAIKHYSKQICQTNTETIHKLHVLFFCFLIGGGNEMFKYFSSVVFFGAFM